MAVGYIKKKQKLSVNGAIREVYLAKVCHGTEVRTDALADEISKTCSASPADVLMVLHAMEDCVGTHLAAATTWWDSTHRHHPNPYKTFQLR